MFSKEKMSKTIIVSVIFGLLTSIIGSFAILSFFMPADFWLGGKNISNQNQDLLKAALGVKAYGRLEVFEFLDSTLPSVAGIYKKKQAGTQLPDSLYLDKDKLGSGMALTSDGWIVSNKMVIDSLGIKNAVAIKQALAVLVKGKIYDVDSVIYDTWTDIVFLKVNAENLPVVSMGDSDLLKLGDLVFGGTSKNDFWFSYISGTNVYPQSANKSELILSSEKFVKRIKLQDDQKSDVNGGVVVNYKGEMIGIAMADAKGAYVLPVNYFKNIISDVLKNKKVIRPYLGVAYINLSSAIGSGLPNDGVGAALKTITDNSPAAKSGLKAGDIIVGVDDENFKNNKNLAEIISEYKPGEEVNVKVLRDGEEVNLKITLGSL